MFRKVCLYSWVGVFTRGLNLSPMQAFIRSAAHWDAVGGQEEVMDFDQNSVGFFGQCLCFCFCVATKTDQSQSIIYKATGSAHYFLKRLRIKAYIGINLTPLEKLLTHVELGIIVYSHYITTKQEIIEEASREGIFLNGTVHTEISTAPIDIIRLFFWTLFGKDLQLRVGQTLSFSKKNP